MSAQRNIYLTDEWHRYAERIAARLGEGVGKPVSVSSAIREALLDLGQSLGLGVPEPRSEEEPEE